METKQRSLTMLPLAVLTFYAVSGGPYAIEPMVSSAGSFYCLLGLVAFPFVWCLPEALITCELSTTYPDSFSGFVGWVETAFGPRAGIGCGYLTLISGLADTALYPLLFYEYCQTLMYEELQSNVYVKFTFLFSFMVAVTYVNYRGLEAVGRLASAIMIISLMPFLILCIMGSYKVNPKNWLETPVGGIKAINYSVYLNSMVS